MQEREILSMAVMVGYGFKAGLGGEQDHVFKV